MTPAVCRACRALLGITQRELGTEAGLSPQTIADFERSARKPHANNLKAIRAAFEKRGIRFRSEADNIQSIDLSGLPRDPIS